MLPASLSATARPSCRVHLVSDELDAQRAHRARAQRVDHRPRAPLLRGVEPLRRPVYTELSRTHRPTSDRRPRVLCAERSTTYARGRRGCPGEGAVDPHRRKLCRRPDELHDAQVRSRQGLTRLPPPPCRAVPLTRCLCSSTSGVFYAAYASSAVVQATVYVTPSSLLRIRPQSGRGARRKLTALFSATSGDTSSLFASLCPRTARRILKL